MLACTCCRRVTVTEVHSTFHMPTAKEPNSISRSIAILPNGVLHTAAVRPSADVLSLNSRNQHVGTVQSLPVCCCCCRLLSSVCVPFVCSCFRMRGTLGSLWREYPNRHHLPKGSRMVHSRPLLRLCRTLQQSPVRAPAQELRHSRQCVLPQQHQNTAHQ
jgi:hypothetical protein